MWRSNLFRKVGNIYQTIWRHTPEDITLPSHRRKNVKTDTNILFTPETFALALQYLSIIM
jgi:hypothetical protein